MEGINLDMDKGLTHFRTGDLKFHHLAGGSEEPGGLQNSCAEGLMLTTSLSIFSGSLPQIQYPAESVGVEDNDRIEDNERELHSILRLDSSPVLSSTGGSLDVETTCNTVNKHSFAEQDVYVQLPSGSDVCDSFTTCSDSMGHSFADTDVYVRIGSGDLNSQDGGLFNNVVESEQEIDPTVYFFKTSPVYCTTSRVTEIFDRECYASNSPSCIRFRNSEGVEFDRPCGRICTGNHLLDKCRLQLNPCVFFDECFGSEVPDAAANYIFRGVSEGFCIVDSRFEGSYICHNYDSILQPDSKQKMDKIIRQEIATDKVSKVDFVPSCIHSLGAIRKDSGKIRPITDCKRPLGSSINNYMSEVCQDFSYISIDDVTSVMSPGCYFSVLDIQAAYRSVNVHPSHKCYQGFVWQLDGDSPNYMVDNCLCFGLRCAPFIYSQITDFVVRCMNNRLVTKVFGYLDDFIVVAEDEDSCKRDMSTLIDLLQSLGFLVAWDKVTVPSTTTKYLGIILDSIAMEVRLPEGKIEKLKSMVHKFQQVSSCTLKELQVLTGYLAHASTVVRGGRTFSRRLINFVKQIGSSTQVTRIPDWLYLDLEWWSKFCEVFNGAAKIISEVIYEGHTLETDSSMTGFGARWGCDWFLGVWSVIPPPKEIPVDHWSPSPSEFVDSMDINTRELWPVVAAAQKWGPMWSGKVVRLLTDNTQVLAMIKTGRSSSCNCMFWIRELFWLSFVYNFQLLAGHVPSVDNIVPDFLSRFYDKRRVATIPPYLSWDLCCFREGRVRDPIETVPEQLDGRFHDVHA